VHTRHSQSFLAGGLVALAGLVAAAAAGSAAARTAAHAAARTAAHTGARAGAHTAARTAAHAAAHTGAHAAQTTADSAARTAEYTAAHSARRATAATRAAALSRHAIPASHAWRRYVESTGSATLRPVSVKAIGDVTNANALIDGSGTAVLTATAGQSPPTIVLDYGREVGGLPFFRIASVAPGPGSSSVTMRAGYSELEQYLLGSSPEPILPVGGMESSNVAGDANGNNGVGTDNNRADDFTLDAASAGATVGNPVNEVQGGQRYEAITLTTPGTVALSAAGITAKFNNLGVGAFRGYFLSSDATLNRIWFAGAYTAQTDEVPAGDACRAASVCSHEPTILDGAKRDRRPWSGDLSVEGRTVFDSLGFGPGGSDYIKSAIGGFGSAPVSDGSVCGQISDWTAYPAGPVSCSFYSPTYSMYFPINLAEYYLYSGDSTFAASQYQVVKNELAYNRASVDPTTGLSTASGMDWDFYDGSKGGNSLQGGAVTATNLLYYEALADGAWLARQLAKHAPSSPSRAIWQADGAAWSAQAAALKQAINAHLFNRGLGAYQLSTEDNSTGVSVFSPTSATTPTHPATAVPEDANAQAIVFGVAPPRAAPGILAYLKDHLWGTYGPEPFSSDADYSTIISPFITGYELDARFASRQSASALALLRLMWAQMVNTKGPFYTGTLWEKLGQNGQITDSNASLAHGWATAPVSALSSYVLGVEPTSPGYRTWTIAPQIGDLAWAQGEVPTPSGAIASRWRAGPRKRTLRLTVSAPARTSGTVAIPALGRVITIAEDGRVVWPRRAATPRSRVRLRAVRREGQIVFSGVTGTHTFAEVRG